MHYLHKDTLKTLISDVKRELLFYIILNMSEGKISLPEAQTLARDFLAVLPVKNAAKLFIELKRLSERYREARSVFLKYAAPYEEKRRLRTLYKVSKYIKNYQFIEAVTVAKGGVGYGQ